MDQDFFLLDNFSLEDIDFDFNCYNEIDLSSNKSKIETEISQCSSNFDHQMSFESFNEKPPLFSLDFSSNYVVVEEVNDGFVQQGTKRRSCSSSARTRRCSILAKEHVLAEKKRRQKLSELFIALSALLPGLKKADKINILDYAISHMKHLQEHIKKLKEEKEASKEIKSTIIVKKFKLVIENESLLSSSLSKNEQFDQTTLPEIETKVFQNQVLIKTHCKKTKACISKILNVIKNLPLSVTNSIVLPFGDSILDITIVAQMEEDFSVNTLKDVVRKLRLAMV